MSTIAPAVPAEVSDGLIGTLTSDLLDQVVRAWSADPSGSPPPNPAGLPDVVRVGVDLVPVAEVTASVERLGRRYLHRVFTPHERACARIGADLRGAPVRSVNPASDPTAPIVVRYSAESLAGRFAAKEAAVKVLRPVGRQARMAEHRGASGGGRLVRVAADRAGRRPSPPRRASPTMAVSVTHEPMMAAACVVGMRTGEAPAWSRTPPPDRRGK